ncbi:hypothetical protein D9M72_523210 [compost metagenome]
MRRRVGRLEAAALVDRDVNDDGPLLHAGQHFAGHELRRCSPRDEHCPNYQIGGEDFLFQCVDGRVACVHAAGEEIVELA